MNTRVFFSTSVAVVAFAAGSPANALEWFGNTLEGTPCKGNGQGFGPYDYFDVDEPSDQMYQEGRWWEVKVIHADPGRSAMETDPLDVYSYNRAAAEFDYVLRAFPNHPDILYARILLEQKRRAAQGIRPYQTPPECYLQRAAVFRPQQPHVYQLFAMYLDSLGKVDQALEYYQRALAIDPQSPEVNYNVGLMYLKKKDYRRAVEHAKVAYASGFPLPGLRNRLQSLGVWTDEVSDSPGAAAENR